MPKDACEHWAPIRDEFRRHDMQHVHLMEEHKGHLMSFIWVFQWHEVYKLGKFIDDDQYNLEALRFR